jgi:Ni,Fe-hydrogenase maturation factor
MEPAAAPVSSRSPRFLIIGYNRHAAQGLGMEKQVIERIQGYGLANVRTLSVEDLTPELSHQLADADYAFFVGESRLGHQPGVTVRSLDALGTETAGSTVPAMGHSCTPRTLLALANSAYGRFPQAWLIQIGLPTDTNPSAEAMALEVDQVTAKIEALMQHCSQ